jgi:hypothetical protein
MSTEALAGLAVLFILTLLALAGLMGLRAAIRDEPVSRPVLWEE